MYDHIARAFYADPWAILPEKLKEMETVLRLRMRGERVSDERIQEIIAGRRPADVQMAGRVAIVPIQGVISQRVSAMGYASGGVSAEAIGATLDTLVADKQCKSIVLAIDSPGGSVLGLFELCDKIRGLRAEKKIVGIADSMAASAAYAILSQCSETNVTTGGQVGSIGVFMVYEDDSKALEELGVATTVISAGKYKADGVYGPLSDEAKADMQAKVDHYYGLFLAAVAKGRGVAEARVKSDFGEGRMVLAKDAVSRGMADRTATFEQVLSRLGGSSIDGASAEARMAAVRARALEVERMRDEG